MLQVGADVELANGDRPADLRSVASSSTPEATLRRLQAIRGCRERRTINVAPAGRRGHDPHLVKG
jgi:DNA polymerase-3 subunit delta'